MGKRTIQWELALPGRDKIYQSIPVTDDVDFNDPRWAQIAVDFAIDQARAHAYYVLNLNPEELGEASPNTQQSSEGTER